MPRKPQKLTWIPVYARRQDAGSHVDWKREDPGCWIARKSIGLKQLHAWGVMSPGNLPTLWAYL